MLDFIIIGAGVFGTTTALALKNAGYKICLIDQGSIPHPLAASTDISKVIRMEYGSDEAYMQMGELAIEGWHYWNAEFGEKLYHESGLLSLSNQPMAVGDYPFESFKLLQKRGHLPIRLTEQSIQNQYPAWRDGKYQDGFFHPKAGYAESGKMVQWLADKCKATEIVVRENTPVLKLAVHEKKCSGVILESGEKIKSGQVIVAAGAWTPYLVPGIGHMFQVTGHPVFHLKPKDKSLFDEKLFPTFMADVAKTGWYGFPIHPREGVLKIARHAIGQLLHPSNDLRIVSAEEMAALNDFIKTKIPALIDADLVYTRKCLYSDTLDHDFLIDHHPEINNLIIASGGSGHGFKFGPILGELIAAVALDTENPFKPKFVWREMESVFSDASRCDRL